MTCFRCTNPLNRFAWDTFSTNTQNMHLGCAGAATQTDRPQLQKLLQREVWNSRLQNLAISGIVAAAAGIGKSISKRSIATICSSLVTQNSSLQRILSATPTQSVISLISAGALALIAYRTSSRMDLRTRLQPLTQSLSIVLQNCLPRPIINISGRLLAIASHIAQFLVAKHYEVHTEFIVSNANGVSIRRRESYLEAAIRVVDTEAVRCLLAAGADLENRNASKGHTPLSCAIENRQVDAVRILFDRGATFYPPGNFLRPSFDSVVNVDSVEIASLLLEGVEDLAVKKNLCRAVLDSARSDAMRAFLEIELAR